MRGLRISAFAASLSLANAFSIRIPGTQTPILDIDIHISGSNSQGYTGVGDVMPVDNKMGSDFPVDNGMSSGMPVDMMASLGQYDRGLVASTSLFNRTGVATVAVGTAGDAQLALWNGSWWPAWQKPYTLGGNFNR